MDLTAGVRFPAGAGYLSLRHPFQTGSGSHPATYAVSTSGSFPMGTAAATSSDHPPSSSDEVKNAWTIPRLPQYAFMAWFSAKAQGKLYLYLHQGSKVGSWEMD